MLCPSKCPWREWLLMPPEEGEDAVIVKSPKTLKRFRDVGKCSWCGRPTPDGCDPHHLVKRGMGGGSRLDIPGNLVSLCRGYYRGQWVSCHDDAERGDITRESLLAVVAAREGVMQADILAEIKRVQALPKGSEYECGLALVRAAK